jgi:hypothetical protein
MKGHSFSSKHAACIRVLWWVMAISALSLSPSTAFAQKFEIKPTAEKKINQLPVCTENLIRVDDVVESLKLAK